MKSISIETIKTAYEIYHNLQDAESKNIFINKLLFSITGEDKYWHSILIEQDKMYFEKISSLSELNREVIIYGAGTNCKPVLEISEGLGCHISYICDKDNSKQGLYVDGVLVISPEELIEKHKNAMIIISTLNYMEEAKEYLLKYFSEDQVIPCAGPKLLSLVDAQYFADDIMEFNDGEVFVDGGCFDFETSQFLMKRCNVKHIYAFEPDKKNLEKVNSAINRMACKDRVTVLNKGLWDKADSLYFQANGDIMSRVVATGCEEDKIDVVALDEVINEEVTFIKMDIEGSELKALEGARKLICTYKPKLAICIYHKPEDTIDIPAYIHSLVPEYKFWIRHYSWSPAETVLYAKV